MRGVKCLHEGGAVVDELARVGAEDVHADDAMRPGSLDDKLERASDRLGARLARRVAVHVATDGVGVSRHA